MTLKYVCYIGVKTMFCNINLANVLHKYKYFIITDFFL